MAIEMNHVSVWVLNYRYSAPGLENCIGVHFLGAIENETIEQLQERMYREVEAQNIKSHGGFNLISGKIDPFEMKNK